MKTQIKFATLIILYAFAVSIYAQPGSLGLPPREDMLKQLVERLDLSPTQVKKVESILETTRKKMDEMRTELKGGERPPMEKMEAIMKKQDKEIEKVLGDDQLKEFVKMKKERENMRPPMGDRPAPPRE